MLLVIFYHIACSNHSSPNDWCTYCVFTWQNMGIFGYLVTLCAYLIKTKKIINNIARIKFLLPNCTLPPQNKFDHIKSYEGLLHKHKIENISKTRKCHFLHILRFYLTGQRNFDSRNAKILAFSSRSVISVVMRLEKKRS